MSAQPEPVRLDDQRAVSPDAYPLTDLGNSERLIALHGHDLKFCHPWAKWLVWDGRHWRTDDTGHAATLAKATVRAMLMAAAEKGNKTFVSHAMTSERDARIRAMLSLAASDRPVLPDQLDADPWALNCQNGTLDLRTGELRAHDRADHLTKLAPVDYDPDATSPMWEAFLERVTGGNTELAGFLQRAVGYSLSGDVGEQVLFLLYGSGANGKSTFVETLRAVLGDYGQQAPTETLLDRRDGIPNDIARMRGARFVAAVETGEGRRLAESMVKQMTGGDTMVARFMRAEFFEFRPEFKLWLATNHKPTIRGTDEAIWRRIRLIPFEVTIPENERDPDLGRRLLDELGGVLAWAVQGCHAWQQQRLGQPDTIRNATSEYRDEQDVLGGWINDRCTLHDDERALAKDLYNDYRHWCEQNGERPGTQTSFGLRLGERGYDKHRGTKGITWRLGISLRHDNPPETTG